MDEIQYRELLEREIERLREIDRSERIDTRYRVEAGELEAVAVAWDVPTFLEGDGPNTWNDQIAFCRSHLAAGARAIAALASGRLVGIGLMTPAVRPGLAQLAYLHVSRAWRRRGVASELLRRLNDYALQSGARSVYVSATPTGSAVGFYRAHGFRPTATPLPELYELEPEDVHMIVELER